MSKLIVKGAVIAGWYTSVKNGIKSLDIDIQGAWDESFCEAFDVATPCDSIGKSPLTLRLNVDNFILTPNDKGLKNYELDLPCSVAEKFKYVPRLDKDGNISSRELHFVVRSGADEGAAKLEAYIGKVGDHPGAMKINYSEQVQMELEDDQQDAPARGRRKQQSTEAVQ